MDMPSRYDAWKTTDPKSNAPSWQGNVTVTLSLKDAKDVEKVKELMAAKNFDFEELSENPEPGLGPWAVFTADMEEHPNDFEHRLEHDHIGSEIMEYVGHIEVEHDLPDLEGPDDRGIDF